MRVRTLGGSSGWAEARTSVTRPARATSCSAMPRQVASCLSRLAACLGLGLGLGLGLAHPNPNPNPNSNPNPSPNPNVNP